MEDMFELIFEIVTMIISLFPVLVWVVVIIFAAKASNSKNNTTTSTNNTRNYDGITRAGSHYHKGSVGTTRKDAEWEETRCGAYKDEIFGKDTCSKYIKPDYDSLTCEDEDLSGG